jgi:hypothetical protein
MQFDNIQEYISQVYGIDLEVDYLNKNIHTLTYLKTVRIISRVGIDTTGQTAESIFHLAFQAERVAGFSAEKLRRADLIYQLADIHAEIEMLISKSGVEHNTGGFNKDLWANDINS